MRRERENHLVERVNYLKIFVDSGNIGLPFGFPALIIDEKRRRQCPTDITVKSCMSI
jgi:hypothetical protein